MSATQRLVASLVLALCVALPLLPVALDDKESGTGAAAPEPGDGDDPTTTLDGDAPSTTDGSNGNDGTDDGNNGNGDSNDGGGNDGGGGNGDATDGGATDDDPDSTTSSVTTGNGTGDQSPTAPTTTRGPTGTSAPTSPTTLRIAPAGALVPGRTGTIDVQVEATDPSPGAVTVRVSITNATVISFPAECRVTTSIECVVVVPAGTTATLSFGVAVDDGAATVGVAVNATASTPPNPPAAALTIPTSAGSAFASSFRASGPLAATVVGNNLLSCPDGAVAGGVTCDSARAGAVDSTNDRWTMTAVQEDDRGTGSSSSAQLNIGSTAVQRAYLVWAASAAATPAGANSIRLATPATAPATPTATSAYRDITADEVLSINGAWQATADVTELVAAAGSGAYWVADIAASSGSDQWAGWALVVVHDDAVVRDIAVITGLADAALADVVVPITAPASGTGEIAIAAWDGDRGVGGDRLVVAGTGAAGDGTVPIVDSANPDGDGANSTITRNGAPISTRRPAHANTLGVDIDTFAVSYAGPRPTFVASTDDDVVLGLIVTATPRP